MWGMVFLACAAGARAQEAPPNSIGRITGPDLTVESGSAASTGLPSSAPSIYVLPGSVVTVHSGQAQLTLFRGGRLDICGPAKFTLLDANGALTVALNFGKMHIQLPAAILLRIYAPTIIATPLEIGGGARDVTVGLDLQDSMCVHPATGALQLESQFTGEKIIVPENSEFFLAGGKLAPVPGTPGSCQCTAPVAAAAPEPVTPAVAAESTKPIPLPPPKPGQTMPQETHTATAAEAPTVTYAVPVPAPDVTPKPAASAKEAPPATPPRAPEEAANPSVYHVTRPALSYSAPSGMAPTEPSVETLLLVTQAHVQSEYEFHGEVSPGFASAMQNALGEKPAGGAAGSQSAGQPAAAPEQKPKKKGGFWASLKKIFVGNSPDQE